MEILLKKDVANLGYAGEIVKVKAGYAMNYLVPQGFATVATESVKKQHAETPLRYLILGLNRFL